MTSSAQTADKRPHDWNETSKRCRHIEGPMFKYGTPVVAYVRCGLCGQLGYRKPGSLVVYTWEPPQ